MACCARPAVATALAVLVSGCLAWDEERPASGPGPCGGNSRDLQVGSLDVLWQGPDRSGQSHEKTWSSRRAQCLDGAASLSWSDNTMEGSDHELSIIARFDHAPARLAYADDSMSTGSFDFTYREAAFWSGEQLNHVVSVRESSWVEITRWNNATGSLAVSINLDFESECDDGEFNCADGERHRTILTGSTP